MAFDGNKARDQTSLIKNGKIQTAGNSTKIYSFNTQQ